MTDPTGARMRMINSFWDSPRYPIVDLPPFPSEPAAVATPTPTPAAGAGPAPAPPKVNLFVPASKGRKVKAFLEDGLPFKVTTDKPATDVEVRLFELLPEGLRPLGVAFRVDPGPDGAHFTLPATRFAKVKLKTHGKRKVRAIATATGRDGTVGKAQADFTLS
jgi:hypothetical protein